MPITSNVDDLTRFFDALALEIDKGAVKSFDFVGFEAVKAMKAIAPVDTGRLKRGIKKTRSGTRSVEIISDAPYSAAVNNGHKTRQGKGRAPGYKPKPGGKVFVAANPFFTSVVNKLKGDNGELIRRVKLDMNNTIRTTISKYNVRGTGG